MHHPHAAPLLLLLLPLPSLLLLPDWQGSWLQWVDSMSQTMFN
jgi:hypothetical protein